MIKIDIETSVTARELIKNVIRNDMKKGLKKGVEIISKDLDFDKDIERDFLNFLYDRRSLEFDILSEIFKWILGKRRQYSHFLQSDHDIAKFVGVLKKLNIDGGNGYNSVENDNLYEEETAGFVKFRFSEVVREAKAGVKGRTNLSGIYRMTRRYKFQEDTIRNEILVVYGDCLNCAYISSDRSLYTGFIHARNPNNTVFLANRDGGVFRFLTMNLTFLENDYSIVSGVILRWGDGSNRAIGAQQIGQKLCRKDHQELYRILIDEVSEINLILLEKRKNTIDLYVGEDELNSDSMLYKLTKPDCDSEKLLRFAEPVRATAIERLMKFIREFGGVDWKFFKK